MANPNTSATLGARGFMPLQGPIQISTTYQINGGTAIAAGATITDTSKTFTGILTSDTQVAVGYSDAVAASLPAGLVLTDIVVTADNTLSLSWTNTSTISVTPPATSQQFWAVRMATFYGR